MQSLAEHIQHPVTKNNNHTVMFINRSRLCTFSMVTRIDLLYVQIKDIPLNDIINIYITGFDTAYKEV